MLENLTKFSYQTFQESKKVFSLGHKTLFQRLHNLVYPSPEKTGGPSLEAISKLQQRSNQLLEIDWQDSQKGIYPESLLFENQWEEFFVYYPQLCLDLLGVWERREKNKLQDFSPEINKQGYPRYYLGFAEKVV